MGITLYHYWRSSASWRVRWGLAIKAVPHEMVAVNLLAGEEKQPGYKNRNPAGYLPALVVDGHPPLAESLAILEWLEETYPSPSFFSGDSHQRALIRRLAETVNSGIQPLHNLDVLKFYSEDKEEQGRWLRHWVGRGLGVYEEILAGVPRAGANFSVSSEPSLADLCLIPQCYTALRFNIDLAQFPQCRAIYEHALTTPACAGAVPEKFQP